MELPEDNPSLVSRMISCCYHADYDDCMSDDEVDDGYEWMNCLETNVEMYAMLEKFGMADMKKVAERKVESFLSTPLVGNRLLFKNYEILRVVPLIYRNTPKSDRGLRQLVCRYIVKDFGGSFALVNMRDLIIENIDSIIDIIDTY